MAIRIRMSTYKSIATTEDCYVLLHNGYILENVTGGMVILNGCEQIVVQRHKGIKRKLPYKFNHPQYWFVIDDKGNTLDIEITGWMRFKAIVKMNICRSLKVITALWK